IHLGRDDRRRLDGIRLKQRPGQDLVELQVASQNADIARNLRVFELTAKTKVRFDVKRSVYVAEHFETPGGSIDFEITDAQLVGAEAASNVQRPPVPVLEVERGDGHPILSQVERRAAVLVSGSGERNEKTDVLQFDRAGKMRIAGRANGVEVQTS